MVDRIPPEALAPFTGPVFERAKVGLCVTDEDGRVIATNPETSIMFQMSEEEILGHSFLIFVPKAERQAARRSFEAVRAGGFMEQPDWHVRLRDGGTMWVRVSPSLLELEGGHRAIMSVLTDVTSSRTAEAARQQAEHRAQGFMESNVIGVMEWTFNGTVVEMNESLGHLLGIDPRTLHAHPRGWQSFTPTDYNPADRTAMRELLETGSCQPYAKEFVTSDGSRVPVLVASAQLPLEDGRYVTYVLDRTESRLVEVSERESAEALERILGTALDAVVLLDPDGTIRRWQGASERLLGVPADQAVGRSFYEIAVPDRYQQRLRDGIEQFLADGDSSIVGSVTELELLKIDGREVPVELSMSAASSKGKTILCAFIHDLTSRRLADAKTRDMNRLLERRVQERTAELEAAFQELEGFSYSVSHDLRSPLRSINGFASLLLNDHRQDLGSDGIEHLQRIIVSTKRMARLIDDLLGFARLARVELKRQPIDLTRMASETASDVGIRWAHKVEFRVEPGLKTTGDPGLIRLALTNLIENAWKFTSKTDSPFVEVGLDPDKGFFVRDNGAGFDPAFASRLYKPFERLHSSSDFPGSGIGLANVERVIRRHGGKIKAEAELGRGATFYFTLGS